MNFNLTSNKTYISRLRHDLRNPINAIIGYSELTIEDIEDSYPNLNKLIPSLKIVKNDGKNILSIVNDILYNAERSITSKTKKIDLYKYSKSIQNSINSYVDNINLEIKKNIKAIDKNINEDFVDDFNKIQKALETITTILNQMETVNDSEDEIVNYRKKDIKLLENIMMTSDLIDYNLNSSNLIGNILIVDDSSVNLDLFKKQIQHFGHNVKTAEDGYIALKLIKENTFDLILLDLIMPRINGYQVLERLKSNQKTSNIPIIIISALDNLDNIVKCIELGAEDFIAKPFNTILLKTRINHVLEKKQLFDKQDQLLNTIKVEQDKSDKLLNNILPDSIINRLKDGSKTFAERFDDVSIMFADINGFTPLSEKLSPFALIDMLNEIFSEFDKISDENNIEKIKTIGDCYMVASGVPIANSNNSELLIKSAIQMKNFLKSYNKKINYQIGMTIGIHTGSVIAGVIGKNKFSYDLWGDTVNVASRVEAYGKKNSINVTKEVYKKLNPNYSFCKPQTIEIKGKGMMDIYQLND